MKFSVIIPAFNAEKTIERCLMSVIKQSVPPDDFEVVVVDDASNDHTENIVNELKTVYSIHNWKLVTHEVNQSKAISRNDGMKAATGDWICWLDADDFYLPFYLEVMSQAIEKHPESDMFYFGGIVVWKNWGTTIKMPKPVNLMEVFRSGGIMSGGFIFKRKCLEKVGFLPEERSPYALGRAFLDKFPEVIPLYKPGQLDLGNPYGDDYMMWYMLTREYQPKILNVCPYVVVQRGEHQL